MSRKTVIAIGVFDGVHRGHTKVLKEAVRIAKVYHTSSIAVTFSPHPLAVLRPGHAPSSLISLRHRLKLISSAGIDKCVVINFTKKFANISADKFIRDIVIKRLNADCLVVGEDFCFGKDRIADVAYLRKVGKKLGFAIKQVPVLKYRKISVSSSFLRRAIQDGKLRLAKRLLGRPVIIFGTVVAGAGTGQIVGFPTANINPHHETVPPSGVYAVLVRFAGEVYNGVLNIGLRPTFYGRFKKDKEPTIEVHIFDFSENIYGKDIEVEFVRRLRPERKFATLETLARQIRQDIEKAKKILR